MTTWSPRWFACLVLVLSFIPVVAAAPDDAEIARLVKQLGDDEFEKREDATTRLKEIGEPALDGVTKATTNSDPEVRRRAGDILAVLEDKLYGAELYLPGHANSVSVSADGNRLLTIDGKMLRLWDADTGKVLRVFEGHTDQVNDAALSPDGTQVLSGCGFQNTGELQPRGDHSVRLWDAKTGKELCKYEGHATAVSNVAFGPEGRAISGDSYGCMHQWDLKTGKAIRIFVCHEHPRGLDATAKDIGGLPVRVAYNAKAKLAVTCGVHVHIRLWNLETGKEVRKFYQLDEAYVCFSPDGKRLAGVFNHQLRIWDVETGKILLGEPVTRPEGPTHIAFSPDGKRIITSNSDKTVRILDATSGRELYKSECHSDYVLSATFVPDGKRIASLISDYRGDTIVRIWRAPR